MAKNPVFTIDDNALYATWRPVNDGVVSIFVPGVCEVQMTFEKAEELAKDLARQAEYGRWYAMEKRHDKEKSI